MLLSSSLGKGTHSDGRQFSLYFKTFFYFLNTGQKAYLFQSLGLPTSTKLGFFFATYASVIFQSSRMRSMFITLISPSRAISSSIRMQFLLLSISTPSLSYSASGNKRNFFISSAAPLRSLVSSQSKSLSLPFPCYFSFS